MIQISNKPIDVEQILRSVHDVRCGASVLFLGTTRSVTDGKQTLELEYECYEAMAQNMLQELATEASRRWPILQCSIVHRTGPVAIGEPSVAVAVSSPHRADAFEAGEWLIDSIKHAVPIWKKEHWADGQTEWQHPQAQPTFRQGSATS